MRKNIIDLVKIVSETLPLIDPIYEFGSLQVEGQEGFADLRPLFPGFLFVGADFRFGTGVDIILDLHQIDLPSESAGTVFCLETLEHTEYPHTALSEIHRILKPDGFVLISSLMKFPIHDFPNDYWRFTPEAFKSLLKPFTYSFVGAVGEKDFPHTVIGIGFKGKIPDLNLFKDEYHQWVFKQETPTPRQKLESSVKRFLPPVLHPGISKLWNKMVGPPKM